MKIESLRYALRQASNIRPSMHAAGAPTTQKHANGKIMPTNAVKNGNARNKLSLDVSQAETEQMDPNARAITDNE